MTMSIQTSISGNPCIHSVYPVIMGNSKVDHREPIKLVLDDIKSMANGMTMWNAATRCNEKLGVHLVALVQDQPERRNFAGLLLGGSIPHPRWGWSCNIAQMVETMSPCQDCREELKIRCIQGMSFSPRECDVCCNWMAHPNKIRMRPIDDYPVDETDEGKDT